MQVTGLEYKKRFVSRDLEQSLIDFIDQQPWNTDLSRRTQHYGYKYVYRRGKPNMEEKVPEIPKIFLDALGESVSRFGDQGPNQVIVNEYNPGQGIAAHIDDIHQFGDTICSISLLSGVEMEFKNRREGLLEKIYLRPRSVVWLTGEARYKWTHQIRGRKTDLYKGEKRERGRRVSITYRVKRSEHSETRVKRSERSETG